MTTIHKTAAAKPAATATKAHSLAPADLKTAAKLKDGINDLLSRARLGPPLAAADAPKSGAKGWTAPNGDKLFAVQLSAPPPAGSADMPSNFALVDPKTNQFFSMTAGGITGRTFAFGPVGLPAGLHFQTKHLTATDLHKLETAANAPPAAKAPTKQQMLGAMGAYEFQGLLKYGAKGPAAKDVAARVELKKEHVADGFTFTAIQLKSDPNKFVIERSGGFAGVTQYSQPIDVTRIPK
jgi:hypothetical protein